MTHFPPFPKKKKNALPLNPLDYQRISVCTICICQPTYIRGFEGTVRLLSTNRGQVKDKSYNRIMSLN